MPRPSRPTVTRSPEAEALSALIATVFRLNGRLAAAGDALAAPFGQSAARWQVMAAVEDAPRSVADIARLLGLARQSVQRVADLLAEAGLSDYDDNPAHVRAKLVRLTARGRTTLRGIQKAQAEWAEELARAVGPTALTTASQALERLLAAMRDGADPTSDQNA